MRIIDLYQVSILHRYNLLLLWFPRSPPVSFPSAVRPHSKSCLPCVCLGWWTALTPLEIYRQSRSPLPTTAPNPETLSPVSPGGGWGFNFQNLPSTHIEEPPTAPVIPTTLSSRSKKALSNVSGTSSQSKYATPTQTPARIPAVGNRNPRPSSTATSTDDEVSSALSSSEDGLSTPPALPGRALTPIYGSVGLPPAPGTGRNAPMMLPTQTPGTGRTNPMNLPPLQTQSQQQSNAETMAPPPPGVMNEPPPQQTTASMRGKGAVGRGRKRR